MPDSIATPQTKAPKRRTRHPDFPPMVAAIVDVVSVLAATGSAYFLAAFVYWTCGTKYEVAERIFSERWQSFGIVVACLSLWFFFAGHYHKRTPFWSEAKEVVQVSALALLGEGFLLYSDKAEVSRLLTFATWLLAPFFIMAARLAVKCIGRSLHVGVARLLVIGGPAEVANAESFLRSDRYLGYEVVDRCAPMSADLVALRMIDAGADGVVIALSGSDGFENAMTAALKMTENRVLVIPPHMGMASGMNVQYVLGEQSVLLVDRVETVPVLSRTAKRLFDVVLSAAALVVLAIPMLVVGVLVRLDGGPAIYGHLRVGEKGRQFKCLKFRSMRPNSQGLLDDLLARDPAAREEWEQTQKLRDDPRVTWFGRIIRKAAVDEIPQFINVLRGDMSFVGPRPVTLGELAHYGEETDRYTSVRPGITGLWQVSGRSDLSYAQRVSLDTWYVLNWSPWHDLAIILKTIPAVLSRKGAY